MCDQGTVWQRERERERDGFLCDYCNPHWKRAAGYTWE